MTLAVPEDLFALIKKRPEIKWSVVAREAMWDYARRVDLTTADLAATFEESR